MAGETDYDNLVSSYPVNIEALVTLGTTKRSVVHFIESTVHGLVLLPWVVDMTLVAYPQDGGRAVMGCGGAENRLASRANDD